MTDDEELIFKSNILLNWQWLEGKNDFSTFLEQPHMVCKLLEQYVIPPE